MTAGRRVVLTGGARGIGARMVERFVECGDRVVVLDRPSALERSAASAGGDVHGIAVDLADAAAVPAAVQAAGTVLGGFDVVVNNAGVFLKTPLATLTAGEWDAVMAVNARAPMLVMRAALDRVADGTGRIVNIASMAAKRGTPGEAAYAASKAALVALTRIAAMELGPRRITVNAVCPGYVLTDMGAATRSDAQVQEWSRSSPLGRLATTDDVADAVLWLASPAAGYLTGQALDVSGGMVMG